MCRNGAGSRGHCLAAGDVLFFFQAEDGIRDLTVTGVQTCALPIYNLFYVVAVMYGTTGEVPDVYSNEFPALYSQGAGAAFALTGVALYMARGHLKQVIDRKSVV